MKSSSDLRGILRSINRSGYGAYKSLYGAWDFGDYVFHVDYVQSDPFAPPSNVHVEIAHDIAKFPEEYYKLDCSRIGLQDFLIRKMGKEIKTFNFRVHGSGKSGLISISKCGQKVIERSACQITPLKIIVRFNIGFPGYGRSVAADELEKILFDFLPKCVQNSLFYANLNPNHVKNFVFLMEDQIELRKIMKNENIVSFVANQSILPRMNGVSDKPMNNSVPFVSPPSLERTFVLPHKGEIKGMAIPAGITLIVGGGYHGKSTLLEAIQMGVYNHRGGDGREFVLTDESALKLRAEDGRCVKNVDISLFISNLPNGKDTTSFTSEDASGSTSQAAALIEGIEADTKLLLIDEDTSATNFMVRDELMQKVIKREGEPITPFLERARDLFEQSGISTILVAGSSGAFFFISDFIIQMENYLPYDITEKCRESCVGHPQPRIQAPNYKIPVFRRIFKQFNREARSGNKRGRGRGNIRGGRKHEHMKIKTFDLDSFSVDYESVDIRYLEQLVDREQTMALALIVRYGLEQSIDGKKDMRKVVSEILQTIDQKGWDPLCTGYIPCGIALPRKQEIFASFNRFRD
ncbi:putative ATPase of the ABC class [Tritrichomonas foetus]|uniref:ATPase of the ABC class n=1 Tax=Tritrichomonas foetus TaxID=1144522 RepID=A0A1J4KIR8_9EUKA|nr:putative ATPase of the ABC class [Tritrichomonas foetus]|eukprot:OHT09716.1 putative ATPase of the ABC class [Tritrichomonas foetus]